MSTDDVPNVPNATTAAEDAKVDEDDGAPAHTSLPSLVVTTFDEDFGDSKMKMKKYIKILKKGCDESQGPVGFCFSSPEINERERERDGSRIP